MEKKINLNDVTIQIRILKALADVKPFGVFKNFYMVRILRNLKQPNVITAKHIWEFLGSEYDIKSHDEKSDPAFKNETCFFDQIFDE